MEDLLLHPPEHEWQDLSVEGLEGGLFQGSVIEESEVVDLVERISAELGPIDVLVLNATPDQPHMPIEEYE